MKYAFTMIELIFVIVILGILGAVAIPRLSATREDAVNVNLAQNIMTGAGEIGAYSMAKGRTEDNLSMMSNALNSLVTSGKATVNTANRRVDVIRGDVSNCVYIAVAISANEENLTINFGNAGADSKCLGLQTLIDTSIYPMVLRGVQIVY